MNNKNIIILAVGDIMLGDQAICFETETSNRIDGLGLAPPFFIRGASPTLQNFRIGLSTPPSAPVEMTRVWCC